MFVFCFFIAFIVLGNVKVEAAHQWVYSRGTVDYYVDDASFGSDDSFMRIRVYVKNNRIPGTDKNYFMYLTGFPDKGYFYGYERKLSSMSPVTYENVSGYVLDFIKSHY